MSTDSAESFFENNSDDYDAKHYGGAVRSFMTVRQERVFELIDGLGLPKGCRVLDAACGPGHILEGLARRGYEAWGLDASKSMLDRARDRVARLGPVKPFHLQVGSVESLPYHDGTFDLVVSTGVIEYLETDRKFLREIWRVLRPGGYLVLPVTNRWSPVNLFDPGVEFLKRQWWFRNPVNALLKLFGGRSVLPRHFHVRKHAAAEINQSLAGAGFGAADGLFFYFLPWPRPFDRVAPRASAWIGSRMEQLGRSFLGWLAEGYLTLSRKPGRPSGAPVSTAHQQ